MVDRVSPPLMAGSRNSNVVADAARDPRVRAAVASAAVAAGGAVAAGKLVRGRIVERSESRRRRSYRLQTDEPVAEGVRRIARGQIDLAVELLENADDGDLGRGHPRVAQGVQARPRPGPGGPRRAGRRDIPSGERDLPRRGTRALERPRRAGHGRHAGRSHQPLRRGDPRRRLRRPARHDPRRGTVRSRAD